jgi:hypothetical protein
MFKKAYSLLIALVIINLYADQLFASPVPSCTSAAYYPMADDSVTTGLSPESQYANSFTITLLGGWGDFTSWVVSESEASQGSDSCVTPYTNTTIIPAHPTTSNKNQSWLVSGTTWGPDYLGWLPGAVAYIKANQGTMYISVPCLAQINQKLEIDCPNYMTPYVYNPSNPLQTITNPATIQNCRGNEGNGFTCGTPISY